MVVKHGHLPLLHKDLDVNSLSYSHSKTFLFFLSPKYYVFTANGAAVTFQTTDWKTWRRAAKPLTYSNITGGWEVK